MTNGGSFISEVFRDGKTFFFEATFTPWRWSSRIWDEWGASHGSIACMPTSGDLEGDALEDAVCEWVHRAVFHEVGFAMESENGLRQLSARNPTAGEAANAQFFGEPRSPRPEVGFGSSRIEAREVALRNADLRRQSSVAMAKFCLAADEFQRSWRAHGAGERRRHSDEMAIPRAASFPAAFPPRG